MSDTDSTPPVRQWRALATSVLALVVTLYGLANVMPAIGDFRIGPFPMVFFRASFFALCVLVVALGLKRTGKPWFDGLMELLALAATAMLMWACVKYYYVGIEIDEAMFLFGPYERWIALGAAAASLFFCWRYWGFPVAILGVIGILYMITGPYWPGPLQTKMGF